MTDIVAVHLPFDQSQQHMNCTDNIHSNILKLSFILLGKNVRLKSIVQSLGTCQFGVMRCLFDVFISI